MKSGFRKISGQHVVVEAGDSAGQAALHLARYASSVTMLVRNAALGASMSDHIVTATLRHAHYPRPAAHRSDRRRRRRRTGIAGRSPPARRRAPRRPCPSAVRPDRGRAAHGLARRPHRARRPGLCTDRGTCSAGACRRVGRCSAPPLLLTPASPGSSPPRRPPSVDQTGGRRRRRRRHRGPTRPRIPRRGPLRCTPEAGDAAVTCRGGPHAARRAAGACPSPAAPRRPGGTTRRAETGLVPTGRRDPPAR